MNAQSNWKQGQQVVGTYCGQTYSGKINEATRPTPDYNNMIFCVTLDEPITVFGEKRERIEIWTNGSDTIEGV